MPVLTHHTFGLDPGLLLYSTGPKLGKVLLDNAVHRGRLGARSPRHRNRGRHRPTFARARLPEGLEGIAKLHALIAEHAPAEWVDLSADQVVVGIETDRGPWVVALQAAGNLVFAINPLSAARYRQRHSTSGAKSDAGDAQRSRNAFGAPKL